MGKRNMQSVYSVNGSLQAISVQSVLENAGIPVNLKVSKSGSYLDVMVPEDCVFNATNLLYPEPCPAEFLSARAL
jgi:hypothetical protein